MSNVLRSDCLGSAIALNVYSWFCLFLNLLLVCMLWRFGERWTYVSLIAAFLYLSTTASIVQQLHYIVSWREIKTLKYEKQLSTPPDGTYVSVNSNPMDEALFLIQFYCYNVEALLVLFWAGTLFRGCWGFKMNFLGSLHDKLGMISKLIAIGVPVIVLILMNLDAIINIKLLYYIVVNAVMAFGLFTGSVLLTLTLFKYVKTRRLLIRPAGRSRWWYTPSISKSNQMSQQYSSTEGGSESESTTPGRMTRRAIYDRSLIIRFTIAFICLAAFEIATIVFQIGSTSSGNTPDTNGPDLTVATVHSDLVSFIPGVSASIAVFLIIGTTKSWAQYRDLMSTPFKWCGCCRGNRRHKKNAIRMQDETPLAYEESASGPPTSPYGHGQSGSVDEDLERTVEMVDVTKGNPLRRNPTVSSNFSKPLPRVPSNSTLSRMPVQMPPPVVLTSTTIEVETSSEPYDYRRELGDRVFKMGPLTSTTVTAIKAENPYVEETKSVAFNPTVSIQGQGQGALRTPDFYWDSASEKGVEIHEKRI